MTKDRSILTGLSLIALAALHAADGPAQVAASEVFNSHLQLTLNQHLNQLLKKDGALVSFKGKTSEGDAALAFYLMFEITGEPKFRNAAVQLANQVLRNMRATKFGVLPIKEKD